MADWFESWSDSEFYHLLYQNRDTQEAEFFLSKVISYLNLPENSKLLDLACGKGRHAIYLNKLGFNVVGTDLSPNSIASANKYANPGLQFRVADMRKPLPNMKFDVIFNLLTSFGYFDNESDNELVLGAVYQMLEKNGLVVIDFLNAQKVKNNLVHTEEKMLKGTLFSITREIKEKSVIKHIKVTHQNEVFSFSEKVQLILLDDFKRLFERCGFELKAVFGDYNLGTFAPDSSDRLILIAYKI